MRDVAGISRVSGWLAASRGGGIGGSWVLGCLAVLLTSDVGGINCNKRESDAKMRYRREFHPVSFDGKDSKHIKSSRKHTRCQEGPGKIKQVARGSPVPARVRRITPGDHQPSPAWPMEPITIHPGTVGRHEHCVPSLLLGPGQTESQGMRKVPLILPAELSRAVSSGLSGIQVSVCPSSCSTKEPKGQVICGYPWACSRLICPVPGQLGGGDGNGATHGTS